MCWLLQCFESSDNSSVRKSSMLCLVALHDKVGKDLLPLLASLNPSKVLTTDIFIFIYCLIVYLVYATEAICLTTTNIRALNNCINRALYKTYGACDNDSLLHLRYYLDLPNVNKMIENGRLKLMDKLVEETKFAVLCNVFIRNLF